MWKIDRTEKTRTKTTYRAGDQVIVTLVNDGGGDEQQTKTLTWTYDGEQEPRDFRKMVKNEVTAMLQHLNRPHVKHVITDQTAVTRG